MDIYYTTNGHTLSTFSRDSHTVIRDGLVINLIAAGWTALASTYEGGIEVKWLQSGSDDWGNFCKFRFKLNKVTYYGNVVEIAFVSPLDDTILGYVHLLVPVVSNTITLIANKFQFFAFDVTLPATDKYSEVMGGLLWDDGRQNVWSLGDTHFLAYYGGFTTHLTTYSWGKGAAYVQGVGVSKTGDTKFIRPSIFILRPCGLINSFAGTCSRFADGVGALTQVPLSMGIAFSDKTYVRGYLYDATVAMQMFTIGATFNFDEHDWYNLTNQCMYGSLLLALGKGVSAAKGYTY